MTSGRINLTDQNVSGTEQGEYIYAVREGAAGLGCLVGRTLRQVNGVACSWIWNAVIRHVASPGSLMDMSVPLNGRGPQQVF